MQFRNEYGFLSNFQYAAIEYDGMVFPTVENAFQAAKTEDKQQRTPFLTAKPGEAKKLGRRVTLRKDWEAVKFSVMKELLAEKFPADPKHKNYWLSRKLLDTGSLMLVEENRWHDNVWGTCTCDKCRNKPHRNMLGILLMERRTELNIYSELPQGAEKTS